MKNKKNLDDLDDIIDYDNNDENNKESNFNQDALLKSINSDVSDKDIQKDPKNSTASKQEESKETQFKNKLLDSDSKFFAIRITGGQENIVANILQNKINSKKINLRSILILEHFKGYVIVEASDSNVVYEALYGIRHVRGQIRGDLPFSDIEKYLIKKPVVTELNVDDTVEVVAGPFKSMKAKITRVDYEKQEATVVLLDSPYQIPVTVDANYLKKITT
ncbi:MAG TPA: transcription elongation factor Spt5 [Nitrososphaeraceae archaeon]|jgi:transcriptional antiterminator NusG|nr:transcription elongation factor Spt5 [Nitrososphaeraceae archaeon]